MAMGFIMVGRGVGMTVVFATYYASINSCHYVYIMRSHIRKITKFVTLILTFKFTQNSLKPLTQHII